ncbi:geranylgeranyl diphosphate synthase type I [Actinocrispum wychmicini]|uniref:Geranylgeranyl diphosphate synthase type I n=2 Tax=Actinocrispum wychmicini TaxID=1213861 RepID=A0A4R2ILM6_9PSEU|nr:geranylgeranyl diphosphate synthase type I [Actinocrispum wychmicini]
MEAGAALSTRTDPGQSSLQHARLRRAETQLEHARQVTEPVLRDAVQSLPEALRLMAGYHFGWWDHLGVAGNAPSGKALRPALVLAAATIASGIGSEAAVGQGIAAAVARAAAAVELVHNFTLLHDDVMDADETRRGRRTVWHVWGIPDAILTGDALQALSVTVLADTAHPAAPAMITRLATCVAELCQGQHEDNEFETRLDVDLDQCVRVARRKTGALLGCSCALGAICAHAGPGVVEAMDRFGRELGVAFQIVDDMLGIWGDPAVTRKPAGSDLVRRKKTGLVIAALSSDTHPGRELRQLYRQTCPLDPAAVARAATLIEQAGGKQWAHHNATRYVQLALDALPDQATAGDLLALADLATQRER